jgi:hypothetical protein
VWRGVFEGCRDEGRRVGRSKEGRITQDEGSKENEDTRLAFPLLERVVRERTGRTFTPSVTVAKSVRTARRRETYMVKQPFGHACDS